MPPFNPPTPRLPKKFRIYSGLLWTLLLLAVLCPSQSPGVAASDAVPTPDATACTCGQVCKCCGNREKCGPTVCVVANHGASASGLKRQGDDDVTHKRK